MPYKIQVIRRADKETIAAAVRERWGDEKIIVHHETFHTTDLPGLKAVDNGEILGFLHYQVWADRCEIITLASLQKRLGIGKALVQAVEEIARTHACRRITATTTNDNLGALIFYQRCGFTMIGVGLGLVDEARKLKPSIPVIGENNIPIHDEIYLEKALG